jgi:DNA-directed RNA polymerase specialized sigma24 family protein
MFQIYENKEEKPGCFMFFGRDGLEYLHQDWKKKRKAYYWAFKKFHGFFSWVLPHLIDEEAYEKKKDAAILALANEKDKIDKLALQRQKVVENARAKGLNFGEISSLLGIDEKTLRRWRKEWDIRRN